MKRKATAWVTLEGMGQKYKLRFPQFMAISFLFPSPKFCSAKWSASRACMWILWLWLPPLPTSSDAWPTIGSRGAHTLSAVYSQGWVQSKDHAGPGEGLGPFGQRYTKLVLEKGACGLSGHPTSTLQVLWRMATRDPEAPDPRYESSLSRVHLMELEIWWEKNWRGITSLRSMSFDVILAPFSSCRRRVWSSVCDVNFPPEHHNLPLLWWSSEMTRRSHVHSETKIFKQSLKKVSKFVTTITFLICKAR